MSFCMKGSNRTARRCWLRAGPGSSQSGLPRAAQPLADAIASVSKMATRDGTTSERGTGFVSRVASTRRESRRHPWAAQGHYFSGARRKAPESRSPGRGCRCPESRPRKPARPGTDPPQAERSFLGVSSQARRVSANVRRWAWAPAPHHQTPLLPTRRRARRVSRGRSGPHRNRAPLPLP